MASLPDKKIIVALRMISSHELTWLAIILIGLFFTYYQSLSNSFLYWDDYFQVTQITKSDQLNSADLKHIFTIQSNVIGMYQPLTTLFFYLEKNILKVSWSTHHTISLLWHCLNVLLVYYLTKLISKNKLQALIVSALFAFSPINTEAIVWISARSTLISSSFLLFSAICYWHFLNSDKKRLFYLLSLTTFILALLAKAPAVILVPILLIMDYLTTRKITNSLVRLLPFFSIAIIFVAIAVFVRSTSHVIPRDLPDYNLFQLFTINLASVSFYFQRIITPLQPLALEPYPSLLRHMLPFSQYVYAFITIIASVVIIFISKKSRLVTIVGLVYLLSLLVFAKWDHSSTPFIADRYLYLPALAIFYGFAIAVRLLIKRWPQITIALGCYLILLAFLSNITSAYWQNDLSYWDYIIGRHPDFALAYSNRAWTHTINKNYKSALDDYYQCNKLDSENSFCLLNSSTILLDVYQQAQQALALAQRASQLDPLSDAPYYRLALTKQALGDRNEALVNIRRALAINDSNLDYQALLQNLIKLPIN
jgi:hypothetical protein